MSRWRRKASAVIAAAIREGEAKGLAGEAMRQHVSRAYPFGERANHPYKVWLSEVRFQLGLGLTTSRRGRRPNRPSDDQGSLFPPPVKAALGLTGSSPGT